MVLLSCATSHFCEDGSKAVRLSITLDVSLPAAVNVQVSATFDTVKEKLTQSVGWIKTNKALFMSTLCYSEIDVCK